jgi:hypothetical protein
MQRRVIEPMSFDEPSLCERPTFHRALMGPQPIPVPPPASSVSMNTDIQPPNLPLEEIGLHLLLERIHRGTASASDFARIAMIHPELIQGGAIGLSEAGKHKLQALRAKLAASNDEHGSIAAARGIQSAQTQQYKRD